MSIADYQENEMQTMKFDVQGMTCGGCVGSAQRALDKLDGVERAEVTLQPAAATVVADPAKVTAGQIVSALAKIGLEAQPPPSGA